MSTLSTRLVLTVLFAGAATSITHAEKQKPIAVRAQPAAPVPRAASDPAVIAGVTDARGSLPDAAPRSLLVGVRLADVGLSDGFRLTNLGGRREVYIPVPQGVDLNVAHLVLALDDASAHDARRNLEILVNDRSVSAIALDGKSAGRVVRIALENVAAREGFLKLSFIYSGAATQDRCIDVRYVGDSLTVRPESAIEFEIGMVGTPNITATTALMPQDVTILLSNPKLAPQDIATALTLARSLSASGRRVAFQHGVDAVPELVSREDRRKWTRGLIVVGPLDRIAARLDAPAATLVSAAVTPQVDTTLTAARIGGVPVLLVTDPASARAGRLLGNPALAALRETPAASVRQVAAIKGPVDRISFDQLGVAPAQADVFGRADLAVAIASRTLPGGTRPSRMVLDVMVAPDSTGEKAVVSAYVNERLLSSAVAAIGIPTQLDFPLSDGLVGTVANIRVVIQRRSAQGDCRFEPQGYPAELLGSSTIVLSPASPVAADFSDLAPLWANGLQILIPASTAVAPLTVIGLLADVLKALSKESAPLAVKFVEAGAVPAPDAPFIAVSSVAPAGSKPRVRFDLGRVAVNDRVGRTRLDVGGLATGAVAQIVTSGAHSGLWIKPLTDDGSLPVAPAVNLDRGDVAFLDKTGIALALSTERDTLLRISYPEGGSWLASAERFRPWIIGMVWGLVSIVLLFVLQRLYRRRVHATAK